MQRALAPLVLVALLGVGTALGWLGCGTVVPGPDEDSPIAARLGDEVVTVEDLDDKIKDDLFQRETRGGNPSRLHELRSQALDQLIAQRAVEVEAERRGLTVEQLLEAEVGAMAPVTDEDVARWYQENQSRVRGAPLDQVAPQIRDVLEGERRQRAVEGLVAAAGFDVLLEQPRVEPSEGGPSLGPVGARVTIFEYSDFQCPYCQRASPVLKAVAARYPEDVRVVYKHLPLDSIHPRARAGAEASACADEGGRFWEYHDLLFANPRALSDDDLRRYAEEVGLDTEAFDECFTSRRHRATVEADAREATALGISGTPAFVVNGIVMFGLQSEDALDRLIQQELAREEVSGS